jgi:hypothetical protein
MHQHHDPIGLAPMVKKSFGLEFKRPKMAALRYLVQSKFVESNLHCKAVGNRDPRLFRSVSTPAARYGGLVRRVLTAGGRQ